MELALKLLDENEIRGYKLHVEVAQFQLKGEYDASKKKKKCKDYKKKLSQQQKYVIDFAREVGFSASCVFIICLYYYVSASSLLKVDLNFAIHMQCLWFYAFFPAE